MLILTRRVGETIMIGDDVTITVLGVKGNQVRVGINAPKSIAVHREEIYERIKREHAAEAAEKAERKRVLHRLRPPDGPSDGVRRGVADGFPGRVLRPGRRGPEPWGMSATAAAAGCFLAQQHRGCL